MRLVALSVCARARFRHVFIRVAQTHTHTHTHMGHGHEFSEYLRKFADFSKQMHAFGPLLPSFPLMHIHFFRKNASHIHAIRLKGK